MGFLDRARQAAEAARQGVDEVRQARAAHVEPVDPAPLSEHDEDVLARALAHGAADPFALLSAEEAAVVVGVPFGRGALSYGDDTLGVRYAARGHGGREWSAEVSAFHATDGRGMDAAAYWHDVLADVLADDATPVADLGDRALARADDVFVLAGPLVFFTAVHTPDGPRPDLAAQLARRVVTRLD